ncbi:MAG: glucose-1-phosphate cytidylyltransferase [Planctomycetes bacterium]|jgi:glucose-1-phosphate cytidylyltransferase|nr:glucose-1-phosphate cytidylyltransferase [Planctomycetota bacterium]
MSSSTEIKKEQVVILCGGQGTRMREETEFRPKALVEIGGKPVLWHLMRHYYHFGYRRFVLCLGYRGGMIKEYFLSYRWMNGDFTLKFGQGEPQVVPHSQSNEDWEISFVDTGKATQTGGRLWRVRHLIEGDTFLANYCDGLSDVNLDELVAYHRSHGKIGTITGFHPHSKYGLVKTDNDGTVTYFQEKPLMNDLTSGGFFVFQKGLFDYLDSHPDCILEHDPFNKLAKDGQMALYTHSGFWQCMDTFKEAQALNELWAEGKAPWKQWT